MDAVLLAKIKSSAEKGQIPGASPDGSATVSRRCDGCTRTVRWIKQSQTRHRASREAEKFTVGSYARNRNAQAAYNRQSKDKARVPWNL